MKKHYYGLLMSGFFVSWSACADLLSGIELPQDLQDAQPQVMAQSHAEIDALLQELNRLMREFNQLEQQGGVFAEDAPLPGPSHPKVPYSRQRISI
jgi:hypothetical protein